MEENHLKTENFLLQLLLELEELVDGEFFRPVSAEEVGAEGGVDALEGVARVGVVPVLGPHGRLVAQKSCHFVKLFVVNITIAIEVKHAECNFKVTARG